MTKKKKIIISILSAILVFIIAFIIFMAWGLSSVSNDEELVIFEVKSGTSKNQIVKNLADADLINSEVALNIYLVMNYSLELQAGVYELSRSDSATEIINRISEGEVSKDTINVTFVEGKNVTHYAELISEKFGYDYDEVINVFKDKTYAKELIARYSTILTDEILDEQIYYPLEGYLFPDTYEFYKTATIKEIIEKLLDQTAEKIKSLSTNIEGSGQTLHEVLTVASIAELEAVSTDDRKKVSQVVYSRLAIPMSLGMDVTSYYGVQRDLKEPIYQTDLDAVNGYNTRRTDFLGLPVGPICNPSFDSITAALNPMDTNYLYFFADVKTGVVTFFEDAQAFNEHVDNNR